MKTVFIKKIRADSNTNSSGSKKLAKDWWDKLGTIGSIFQSLVIGIVTLYITTLWLPAREEKSRKNEMKTEIMSAREQASLSFRGEMFNELYSSIVASKDSVSITERVEKLRIFQEYFHDVFDGKPFFKSLYEEALIKQDTEIIKSLITIAKGNGHCQENHIKESYSDAIIIQKVLKQNDSTEIYIDEKHYCIKIKILQFKPSTDILVAVPVTVSVNDNLIDEIDSLSYFSFPFSDNHRLPNHDSLAFMLKSIHYVNRQFAVEFTIRELKNDFLQSTYWLPLNELVDGLDSTKRNKNGQGS